MIPNFTAEAALVASERQYRNQPRVRADAGVTPQWYERARAMAGERIGGDLAAVTTCTCPCCQVVNGRLVCC